MARSSLEIAARAVARATERGIIGSRLAPIEWTGVIEAAVGEALAEARSLCTYIPDRDAIEAMMIVPSPATLAAESQAYADAMLSDVVSAATQASAAVGPAGGTVIQCFVCQGAGRLGSVLCQGCNGQGVIADSGPAPIPNPGLIAIKPCGCAADWVGSGADDEFRRRRVELWREQGYRSETMDFSEAGPRITAGAGCTHDRRATPRATIGTPDLDDLPPGGSR